MSNYSPDDRPAPNEQPIRARVPDHIAGGAFSTGVIVMTAHTEFILDFVQNLGRPHQIVARVVMPHNVLPQLVDALQRNIELYRGRWGNLPSTGMPAPTQAHWDGATQANPGQANPAASTPPASAPGNTADGTGDEQSAAVPSTDAGASSASMPGSPAPAAESPAPPQQPPPPIPGVGQIDTNSIANESAANPEPPPSASARQASAQDIYDDLKIKDELLSGSYANAVMIGHGPHEFSFDFITNFYPNSAVSARVFLAAGQVPRLYDSLKGTLEQLRWRMQPPGQGDGQSPDGQPPSDPNNSGPGSV